MSIIRIFANGIELDFIKETLTLQKDNNAFINDFKVAHSSFPFLIIENERTKMALGPRDITSVNKQKTVPVIVLELGNRYYGELEITSYLNGYRKCNLKYGSDVMKILNKKLSELMPVISVIPGEDDPVPYAEESLEVVSGYEHWETYPLFFIDKFYPEANFGFPKMMWRGKFGDELQEDDEWYPYKHHYNNYFPLDIILLTDLRFTTNTFSVDGFDITTINQNVPSPQLFLLGILKYAFATIGYTIKGEFTEHELIKRIMVNSLNHNLSTVTLAANPVVIPFTDFTYWDNEVTPQYYKVLDIDSAGTYTFKYKVEEALRTGSALGYESLFYYIKDGTAHSIIKNTNKPDELLFEGEFTVTFDSPGKIYFIYLSRVEPYNQQPVVFELEATRDTKTFHMMHPTIQLGRYAPDMTLATYINEIKKLFCLDILLDDNSKTVTFNFAQSLLMQPDYHQAKKSLAVKSYSPAANKAFVLKYASKADNFVYVSNEGVEINREGAGDYTETIDNKFMVMPFTGGMADLALADDKEGIGLMIYNPEDYPVEDDLYRIPSVSEDYAGQTLKIDGDGGIYETFWKKVLRFRLNASSLEIEGPFTESEIADIDKLHKIYIDHQAYVILSMKFKPTQQDNYIVTLELESINF